MLDEEKELILNLVKYGVSKFTFVYMIECWNENRNNSYIYVGHTPILSNRIYEHNNGINSSLKKNHKNLELIYFEFFNDETRLYTSLRREKELQKWSRELKLKLVKKEDKLYLIEINKLIKERFQFWKLKQEKAIDWDLFNRLEEQGLNRTDIAKTFGMCRTTLYRRIKERKSTINKLI